MCHYFFRIINIQSWVHRSFVSPLRVGVTAFKHLSNVTVCGLAFANIAIFNEEASWTFHAIILKLSSFISML